MPLTIRPATEADRAAVLGLAPRLREGVASWRPEPGVARAVRGWVEGSLASMDEAGHAVLVAELEGRVVGFITLSPGRHWAGELDGSIGELVVDHDAESQGVGASLVEAIIARARKEGYTRISVSTGAANARARGLYARLGFEDEDISLSRALT